MALKFVFVDDPRPAGAEILSSNLVSFVSPFQQYFLIILKVQCVMYGVFSCS